MIIEVIPVSSFQQNARIISCEDTKEAILIDPGDEETKLLDRIQKKGVTIKYIIGTHGHIDHVGIASQMQSALHAPFCMHKDDAFLLERMLVQADFFNWGKVEIPRIDRFLNDGDVFCFGNYEVKVLHTPGHSPGSISLLIGRDVIVGDLLFAGSIGRTDLPGGNFDVLMKSIKEKLYPLPETTKVHTGHGPNTTIGYEKLNSPFLIR